MKHLFAAALVAVTFAGISTASAAEGCGRGFHRGENGRCYPNRGDAVVVAPGGPAVVVVPGGRGCPIGFVWRYGRCRPI